jgi:hypothetical protein
VSAVRQATSRKAREVAHPQLFRSMLKNKPAYTSPLKWPTRHPAYVRCRHHPGKLIATHATTAYTTTEDPNRTTICAPPWPGASHSVNAPAGLSRAFAILAALDRFSCVGSIEEATASKTPFKAMDTRNAIMMCQSGWWGLAHPSPRLCSSFPITKRGCPILAFFARVGRDAADRITLVILRGLHRHCGADPLHFITCSWPAGPPFPAACSSFSITKRGYPWIWVVRERSKSTSTAAGEGARSTRKNGRDCCESRAPCYR